MNKDYLTDCITDLLAHYKARDFIQMAFAYDEIQLCKGLKMATESVFFTEILEDNNIVLSKELLNQIEYSSEPILVSLDTKWNTLSFDVMFEGVVLEEIPIVEESLTPVELIEISTDGTMTLSEKCIEFLDVKQGDILLISSLTEGFNVSKFTEEDIKKLM